jgi:hypothetical protein
MRQVDNYLVRITAVAGATGDFIWEVCRGDALHVFQRSPKAFPTRIEALFDSAQSAARLALEQLPNVPLPFV